MNPERQERAREWLARRLARGPAPIAAVIADAKKDGHTLDEVTWALPAVGGRRHGTTWGLSRPVQHASVAAPAPAGPTWSDVVAAERRERERCAAIATSEHAPNRAWMVASLIKTGVPTGEALRLLAQASTDEVWSRAQARGTTKALDHVEIYARRARQMEVGRGEHAGGVPGAAIPAREAGRASAADIYEARARQADAARRDHAGQGRAG